MTAILVNVAGLALMGAIVWWFWLAPSDSDGSADDHSHHH